MPGIMPNHVLKVVLATALFICLLSLPAESQCPHERLVSFEIQNLTDQEVDGLELTLYYIWCGELVDLWPPGLPGYYDSVGCQAWHFKWYFPPVAPGERKKFRWRHPNLLQEADPQIYAVWKSGSSDVEVIPFPYLDLWPSMYNLNVVWRAMTPIPPEGVYIKRWVGLLDAPIPLDSLYADNQMVAGTDWLLMDEHEHLYYGGWDLCYFFTPAEEPACLVMYTVRTVDDTSPYIVFLSEAEIVYSGTSAVEGSTWGRIKNMYR